MRFMVKIADKVIALDSQYDYLQKYCREYCISECEPDLEIEIYPEEIEAERNYDDVAAYSNQYLETVATLRKLGEVFPLHDRALCHGAVISFADVGGFMFAAPSGTGKSTHIHLWKKYLGDTVEIINGDKPFLEIRDESVVVYGTPWAGKENWQKNKSAELKGICFLKRGKENKIRRAEPLECLELMMHQVYMPRNAEAAGKTLELLEKILERVPVYILYCDISEDAVKCSFEMLTGLEYEEFSIG